MNRLRDAAIAGRLLTSSHGNTGQVGRSLLWKLFLTPAPPLQAQNDSKATIPIKALREARQEYAALLLEKMRAPDGSYEEGFRVPGQNTTPSYKRTSENLNTNNPLGLDDQVLPFPFLTM